MQSSTERADWRSLLLHRLRAMVSIHAIGLPMGGTSGPPLGFEKGLLDDILGVVGIFEEGEGKGVNCPARICGTALQRHPGHPLRRGSAGSRQSPAGLYGEGSRFLVPRRTAAYVIPPRCGILPLFYPMGAKKAMEESEWRIPPPRFSLF